MHRLLFSIGCLQCVSTAVTVTTAIIVVSIILHIFCLITQSKFKRAANKALAKFGNDSVSKTTVTVTADCMLKCSSQFLSLTLVCFNFYLTKFFLLFLSCAYSVHLDLILL